MVSLLNHVCLYCEGWMIRLISKTYTIVLLSENTFALATANNTSERAAAVAPEPAIIFTESFRNSIIREGGGVVALEDLNPPNANTECQMEETPEDVVLRDYGIYIIAPSPFETKYSFGNDKWVSNDEIPSVLLIFFSFLVFSHGAAR